MQIFIDADACPVVGIVEKIAKAHNLPVTLLCDTNHVLSSDYSEVIIVGAGADAVDYKLISICRRGDIVVSQDYGVAAMALGNGQGSMFISNIATQQIIHTTEHRTYYYARVSSTGQNLARQIAAFKKMGAEEREIITDKASGKDIDRPGYQALKTTLLRPGDTLVIVSLDRLSRKKEDIKTELQYFREHNIRLKILDIPTTLIEPPEGQEWLFDMVLNILTEVMASIAEQERLSIRSRQKQGIEALRGTPGWENYGRPDQQIPENYEEIMKRWLNHEITAVAAMNLSGLKRTTFYKLAKKYKNGELEI